MKKIELSEKQLITYGMMAILVIIALSFILSYFTPFRDPISVSFKRLYPAAIVESDIISVNDLEQGRIIAERFGLTSEQAKRQFMDNERAYALAKRLNVNISNDAAADEMRYFSKGNENDFELLLEQKFDSSERIFSKYVVQPQITDAYLRMKFYNDIKSTNEKYLLAQSILEKLSKGEKFEDLSKVHSEDRVTGQIGGDLGFYESGQIIPELEDQISISAMGEFRKDIIVTRLGYHVIYPVEYSNVDGKKMWHAKHMLFVPEGYDKWLSEQTQTISVKYLAQ